MINKDEIQYVGFWDRFHAVLVMTVILLVIDTALSFMFFGHFGVETRELFGIEDILIGYIVPFILTVLVWKKYSSDPGKMLYKAKIVDATTFEKPTTKQFIIRYIGYYLSLIPLGLGYFWVIKDKRKQSFHDKLAHTVVIKPIEDEVKTKWYIHLYRAFIVLIGLLLLLGVVFSYFSTSMEPLIKGDRVAKEKVERLLKHKIIDKPEELIYYGEHNDFFGTFEMLSLITQKSICNLYFNDGIPIRENACYDFEKVGTLAIEKSEGDYFYLYDSDIYTHAYIFGEDEFFDENLTEYGLDNFMVVSDEEKGSFKETVMSLWRKAKAQ